MPLDFYMVTSLVDEFVNQLFEQHKNSEWNQTINEKIVAESQKLSKLSEFTFDELYRNIKAKYSKKINIYKLENQKPLKKRKSIFSFLNHK